MRLSHDTDRILHRALGITLMSALSVLSLASTPVEAVSQSRWTEVEERGWIGISLEVLEDEWGRTESVIIIGVVAGSPADEAGVRPGDRLLAINHLDEARELAELAERLEVYPGDGVVMEVGRAGTKHRVRLTASVRPDDFVPSQVVEVRYAPDMVERWVRAMDSMRVELIRSEGREVEIRSAQRDGTTQRIRIRQASSADPEVTVIAGGSTVQVPFEFFIFRGEEHDSLRQEMVELNQMVTQLELRMGEREEQLRRVGGQGDVHIRQDNEFLRLSSLLNEAALRSSGLETTMAEAARQTAGLEYTIAPSGGQPNVLVPEGGNPRAEFRPLTPYLVGRNRVAGAEVTNIRPELAEYFGVSGGVLVLDVSAGTPAALAGIVPGDVITRLDQVGVRSVEDLRFGISMAGESLPVSLVRQGASVQVLLRR
ncbi:MAG: PDZ domain-containing protein [Longimicrobiales bacterium]|nr:PDZ domain-containing protein [Longimicrobiales bacterium]